MVRENIIGASRLFDQEHGMHRQDQEQQQHHPAAGSGLKGEVLHGF